MRMQGDDDVVANVSTRKETEGQTVKQTMPGHIAVNTTEIGFLNV